ncbi:hypothetical protein [Streptomyces sp. NPDC089919]|uniref:hypothetical protein n=1 Tax=Streptomyces sp. NPDC089919 TaxID=3155188 RepID=UPI0034479EB0
MRVSRTLSAAAAAFAVLGLATPLAVAGGAPGGGGGPSNITVNPFAVHQGSVMDVSASGCRQGGVVFSGDDRGRGRDRDRVFDETELRPGAISFARVRIYDHADPGHYELSVRCHGSSIIGTHQFQVLAGRGAQGGLGGSFGPTATETAIGAGLVGTAALGAGVHLMRRRRTTRGRI